MRACGRTSIEMELQTSLLIVSREFSLYSAVKKTSLAGDLSLFFCRPDEDYLSIVRENADQDRPRRLGRSPPGRRPSF